ncbi:MAG: UDPGP type 1 family protein [Planctomycetes bacterium]|nr:UDPGP type 1 family protein [Planctomycetota bacterium]
MAVSNAELEGLKSSYESAGQGHVFRFWDALSDADRTALLADLQSVNLSQLPGLSALARQGTSNTTIPADLAPACVTPRETLKSETIGMGESLLAQGKVAAFTVAGGQGTRLGFDGPKGAFPISPVKNKTLFQLFADNIRSTERKYGAPIRWYIMTSPSNDGPTREFFKSQNHFGLDAKGIVFFQQGVVPSFDTEGRILLNQPHRLSLSPDGHGGSLLAMATSGILSDMSKRGIDYISYFQVDNPLVACLDPAFIGLHATSQAEMSSKTLPKADDLERVGNFAMSGGRQVVIEYSDLPESLAKAKNPDGARRFDAANIAIHVLSRTFVERLTADRASFALPWHIARKKIPFVDLKSGERIDPPNANGVKLEAFIFDALPLARHAALARYIPC